MDTGYVVSDWYRSVVAMTLRVDDELELALNELAETEGASKQEVVKRAVIERHRRTVRQAKLVQFADEFKVEYAELLRRMADRP